MRKIVILVGILLSGFLSLRAQGPGQLPSTALKLCNTNVLNVPVVQPYYDPNFIPGSCLAAGILNPMYYYIQVSSTGSLGFDIMPVDSCSDYDFQLFNVTGFNVNDIFTNPSLGVSCNYAANLTCANAGITGCGIGGNGNYQNGSGTPINDTLHVTAGQAYLLLVSNFDELAPGYTIQFTGTASIFDTTRPKFNYVKPLGCNNANFVDVKYESPFNCNTLDNNGSGFVLYSATGSILGFPAVGLNCSGGAQNAGDSIRIYFPSPLAPGTYTLVAQAGNDGNSVLDLCDNEQFYNDSVTFTVSGGGVPMLDSASDVGCNVNRVFVRFDKRIRCNSVALNGSDFTITGPQVVNVQSANAVGCVGGLTSIVRINFTPLITTAGTYTVHINVGTDGNTILDTCSQQAPTSDSFVFTAVASVVANYNGFMDYGCERDTIYLDNLTLGALNYHWDFGNGDTSLLFEPTQVYENQAIYPIQLIASNPDCADTVSHNFDFRHDVKAIILTNWQNAPLLDSNCVTERLDVYPNPTNVLPPPGAYFNNWIAKYDWSFGDGVNDTKIAGSNVNAANVLFFGGSSHYYAYGGTYNLSLIVTDTIGCADTAYRTIWVDSLQYQDFRFLDSQLCVGETVYLYDTVAPHSIGFWWDISDGYHVDNIHNITHVMPDAGNYSVTLTTDYLRCPDSTTTKNFTVVDLPRVNLGLDTMICPGVTGPITLIDVNNIGAQYIWSTGDQGNSIVVTQPGKYWVQVTDPSGCTSADTLDIKRDCYVSIPNAFMPGSGTVDAYFIPRALLSSGLTAFKMQIFNRWGELMFETSSLDGIGWDGSWNGKPQPIGVYMYKIDATFRNGQKKLYNGNLTLIR